MSTYIEDSARSLAVECREIQAYLECPTPEDPSMLVQRGSELASYMARTSKMLADAKQIYNASVGARLAELLPEWSEMHYSAKVQNKLADSLCNDYKHLVDWVDRLNASCTHQLDWVRTLISKAKTEMQYQHLTT